jgi:hypothetical protein
MITAENIVSMGVGASLLMACQIIGTLIRVRREKRLRRQCNRAAGTILHIHRL